jgi:ion channel
MRRLSDESIGYGVVLVLIGVTYGVSVTTDKGWAAAVVILVQLLALRIVLVVSHARRAVRAVADVLFLAVAIATVVAFLVGGHFSPDARLTTVFFAMSALLYGIAPLSIVRHTITRPQIDEQTLLAAIAAYLMLGMFFAFTYRFVGAVQAPPFFGQTGSESMANYLFFSFVTLTTTGYGNLVPAANPGQSLAVLEAIVGQLFLVTAVAKIVNESGLLTRGRRRVVENQPGAAPATGPGTAADTAEG